MITLSPVLTSRAAACRLQLSRYLVAAEVQAELTEMLGERMRWI
jgi:hypothetical protein